MNNTNKNIKSRLIKSVPDINYKKNEKILKPIKNILDELHIDYTSNWSFNLTDKYVNANKNVPYNFDFDICVDIYGYVFICRCDLNYEMKQFAIIIDNKYDTITDYYFSQLNINVLNINNSKTVNIDKQISLFIKKLYKTDTRIYPKTQIETIITNDVKLQLNNFYKEYTKNHNSYLKSRKSSQMKELQKIENHITSKINKTSIDNVNYKNPEKTYVIEKSDIDSIIKNRYILTGINY